MASGDTSMPNPYGGIMESGKTGDGYARITSMFTPIKITALTAVPKIISNS